MNDLASRVDEVMADCLFKPEEMPGDKPPENAVIVEGLVRSFAFHPDRIAARKADVAALCNELPDAFHKSKGGGWSFLNLCMDRHGHQWGEHVNCEALVALAIGTGQGGYPLPRDMWPALPGAVPYVWLGD